MSNYNHKKSYEPGQKLQTTIRLESKTFAEIDKIMLNTGVSRAEVIRRLIKKALQNTTSNFNDNRD